MRKSWTENFVKLAENCLQRILAMEFPPYVCRTTRLNSWKCQFDEIFSSSKPAKQISIRILILVNLIGMLFSRNIFELRISSELISRNMMIFFLFPHACGKRKKNAWESGISTIDEIFSIGEKLIWSLQRQLLPTFFKAEFLCT